MRYVPLLFIPFLLYNAFAFLIFVDSEADFRDAHMAMWGMPSGATFTLTVGTTIVLLALLLLAFEVVKAARIGSGSILDHLFATILMILFLLEFVLVPEAATGTFVILMAIAFIDLVVGFAVSLRTASRDVNLTT